MNFGSYFCGVLAALVYDQLALKQYKLRELKSFQLLWFTLIPVGILWLFSAHPIFQHYYVTPSAIWEHYMPACSETSGASGWESSSWAWPAKWDVSINCEICLVYPWQILLFFHRDFP